VGICVSQTHLVFKFHQSRRQAPVMMITCSKNVVISQYKTYSDTLQKELKKTQEAIG
jgi:hypothetical protein